MVKRRRKGTRKIKATRRFGGKTYKKAMCSPKKSRATSIAKKARKMGQGARVVKSRSGSHTTYCVYTRGRKK